MAASRRLARVLVRREAAPRRQEVAALFEGLAEGGEGVLREQTLQEVFRQAHALLPRSALLLHAHEGAVCVPFQALVRHGREYLSKSEFVCYFDELLEWVDPSADTFLRFLDARRALLDPAVRAVLERMEVLEQYYSGLEPGAPVDPAMALSHHQVCALWSHYLPRDTSQWSRRQCELLVLDMASAQLHSRPTSLAGLYEDAQPFLERLQPGGPDHRLDFGDFAIAVHALYDGPVDPEFSYPDVLLKVGQYLLYSRPPTLQEHLPVDRFPLQRQWRHTFSAHELGTLWREHLLSKEERMTGQHLLSLLQHVVHSAHESFDEVFGHVPDAEDLGRAVFVDHEEELLRELLKSMRFRQDRPLAYTQFLSCFPEIFSPPFKTV